VDNERPFSLGGSYRRYRGVAAQTLKDIPMSLKCILIGGALVWGGYYLYKHKKLPFKR